MLSRCAVLVHAALPRVSTLVPCPSAPQRVSAQALEGASPAAQSIVERWTDTRSPTPPPATPPAATHTEPSSPTQTGLPEEGEAAASAAQLGCFPSVTTDSPIVRAPDEICHSVEFLPAKCLTAAVSLTTGVPSAASLPHPSPPSPSGSVVEAAALISSAPSSSPQFDSEFRARPSKRHGRRSRGKAAKQHSTAGPLTLFSCTQLLQSGAEGPRKVGGKFGPHKEGNVAFVGGSGTSGSHAVLGLTHGDARVVPGVGSSQLRASHVAAAVSREQLRLRPSWASLHCRTPLPSPHASSLLRPQRPATVLHFGRVAAGRDNEGSRQCEQSEAQIEQGVIMSGGEVTAGGELSCEAYVAPESHEPGATLLSLSPPSAAATAAYVSAAFADTFLLMLRMLMWKMGIGGGRPTLALASAEVCFDAPGVSPSATHQHMGPSARPGTPPHTASCANGFSSKRAAAAVGSLAIGTVAVASAIARQAGLTAVASAASPFGPAAGCGLSLGSIPGVGRGGGSIGGIEGREEEEEEEEEEAMEGANGEGGSGGGGEGNGGPLPPTSYRVIRVPSDGRCLFQAVTVGRCIQQQAQLPGTYEGRSAMADQLRAKVCDEFVKRRKETEWFLEGDFEEYVSHMREPYVWGGEPELLMMAHVLQSPITVHIADTRPGARTGIIPIAEYGQEYAQQVAEATAVAAAAAGGATEEVGTTAGGGADQPVYRESINVFYNGYNHYDALLLLGPKEWKQVARL